MHRKSIIRKSNKSKIENMKSENEIGAAIAMALHEHLGNNVHDVETGIITIADHTTMWNLASLSMTARP